MICPFCNEKILNLVHIDDCDRAFEEFTAIRKLQHKISGIYTKSHDAKKEEAKRMLDILKPYLRGSRKERIEAREIVLREIEEWNAMNNIK